MSLDALYYQLNENFSTEKLKIYYDFEHSSVSGYGPSSPYTGALLNFAPNYMGGKEGLIYSATGSSKALAVTAATGTNKFLETNCKENKRT